MDSLNIPQFLPLYILGYINQFTAVRIFNHIKSELQHNVCRCESLNLWKSLNIKDSCQFIIVNEFRALYYLPNVEITNSSSIFLNSIYI